jgi:hypothetical protein
VSWRLIRGVPWRKVRRQDLACKKKTDGAKLPHSSAVGAKRQSKTTENRLCQVHCQQPAWAAVRKVYGNGGGGGGRARWAGNVASTNGISSGSNYFSITDGPPHQTE